MEKCKADNIPEKRFLQKLQEISDHYARNIYIKVSLNITVPWILLASNYCTKTLANLFENT